MNWLDILSWQVVAIAVFAVAAVQLVMPKIQPVPLGVALRVAMAAVTAIAVLGLFGLVDDWQSDAERRVLQARASEVVSRALAPGSPLACLNGQAGETAESACETAVFAKPETAAAAVAYTEARLALLADSAAFEGDDEAFDLVIAGLRRSIELDRFGLAAQVLASRDGCTAENCAAFALVGDATTLRANLKARAYDTYVARYSAGWGKDAPKDEAPPAVAAVSDATPQAAKPGQPQVPFNSRYDFPSSASIPPVSIMNPEPPRTAAEPAAAPAGAGEAGAPLPPRRPQAPVQTQGATTR